MYSYKPQKIVIEKEVEGLFFTKKILEKLPKVETEVVENFDWQKNYKVTKSHNPLTEGKKVVYLKRFLGSPIKLCPGFSDNMVCCNYYTLNFIENCPLECTYCILQAIHNRPLITMHTNVEEILSRVSKLINTNKQGHLRIGTGEHSDSLALEHIFGLSSYLVKFFGKFTKATLELKTKTNYIEPLIGLKHNNNTVVSWSINTQEISKKQEWKTATAEQRILAAAELIKSGYKVGFHFDPLIYSDNWEEGYSEIIEFLAKNIPQNKIAWLSIGTLRYTKQLKKVAEERFPKLELFCEEFTISPDQKMRYIYPIRKALVLYVSNKLKSYFSDVPIYLCMEHLNIWQNTNLKDFYSVKSLENYIQSRL